MSLRLPRRQYVDLYGPTVGDRVRLADTDIFIEVERDFTVYGDEVKFGGGKVIRDGMGQSARATAADGVLDAYECRRPKRAPAPGRISARARHLAVRI